MWSKVLVNLQASDWHFTCSLGCKWYGLTWREQNSWFLLRRNSARDSGHCTLLTAKKQRQQLREKIQFFCKDSLQRICQSCPWLNQMPDFCACEEKHGSLIFGSFFSLRQWHYRLPWIFNHDGQKNEGHRQRGRNPWGIPSLWQGINKSTIIF